MKKINKLELTGTFSPDIKFKARSKFEVLIEDQLRAEGKVPVLDMNTQWYISWDDDKEHYDFILVMYGVYVGKKKAREEICGWEQETGKMVLF